MSSVERPARKASRAAKASKRRTPDLLPRFVAPCLAKLSHAPPAGDTWVHEIKFDGYRLQARIDGGTVQLLTRTGLDWTARFPSIAKALTGLKLKRALIDGEVVVETKAGVTSFAKLVEALETGRSEDMMFIAFDLLHLDGVDVTQAPLLARKDLLKDVMATSRSKRLRYSEHLASDGATVLKEACALGLEGVISKRADQPYHSGRGGDWLKSKCIQTDEFVIGGYLVSTVDAKAVGALALGTFEKGQLVYAGRVGTGFTHDAARALWKTLQPLKQAVSPFSTALTAMQRRSVVWVRPELVAQIHYATRTSDGLLRHGAFKGLREDKPANDVHRT
ncbi:non-homologous end-joining DNA ligase [uncultured Hyphomicrobium sp.]|uniref:non-homologous end-joining DNA ligase n=1 Tax=uncultured Hyphomicrobium sp. TaxID=194373 RepID=UPI0025ECFD10|nr:non-homologous end-joining DNA ligase [uncultured Hyphomicrobium sp.]